VEHPGVNLIFLLHLRDPRKQIFDGGVESAHDLRFSDGCWWLRDGDKVGVEHGQIIVIFISGAER
jgi:hypothetical protein